MTHETFHELIALRLYGELDAAETARLEEHLASCTDCRAVALELEETLGAVHASDEAVRDELPAGWRERLRNRALSVPPRPRRSAVLPFVAGLAAGLLLMLTWTSYQGGGVSTGPDGARIPTVDVGGGDPIVASAGRSTRRAPFAARAEPPPRTSSRGPLAHLSELIDR
jgi:anti-sigma factor RsiW